MGPPTKINSPWQRQIASLIREYYKRARMHLASPSRSIDRSGRGRLGCRKFRRMELRLCTRIRDCSGSFGLLVTFAVGARVRPSLRSSVCLSVYLSVRPSVVCPAHFGRVHRRLAPARRVFDRLSLGLYGLWGSFKPPRRFSAPCPLALFPLVLERPLSPSPSPPLAPTRRTRRPKGRKSARRGKVRTSDEDSQPLEAGVNNTVHVPASIPSHTKRKLNASPSEHSYAVVSRRLLEFSATRARIKLCLLL